MEIERQRLQAEHDQIMEIADQEITDRDQIASENYLLKDQPEQLNRAIANRPSIDPTLLLSEQDVQYFGDSHGQPFIDWLIEELGQKERSQVRKAIV